MAKKHSSEAFYALNDPLEAAVFGAGGADQGARGSGGELDILLVLHSIEEPLDCFGIAQTSIGRQVAA
jgi:hypothetical protein